MSDDVSLDALAQSAPNDPVAFSHLVEALRTRLHGLVQKDQLDIDNDLRKELKRVRQHFSNLKAGFLNLETKQRFLSIIKENSSSAASQKKIAQHQGNFEEILPLPTEETIQSLESNIKTMQSDIHQVHEEIKTIQGELRKSIPEMLERWNFLEIQTKSFIEQEYHPEETERNKQLIQALFPDGFLQDSMNSSYDSAMNEISLQTRFSQENEEIFSLQSAMEKEILEIQKNKEELLPLKTMVETMKGEIQQFQQNPSAMAASSNGLSSSSSSSSSSFSRSHEYSSIQSEKSQLQQSQQWYSSLLNIFHSYSNMEILNPQTFHEECEIQLLLYGNTMMTGEEDRGKRNSIEIVLEFSVEQENIPVSSSSFSSSSPAAASLSPAFTLIGARLLSGPCDSFDDLLEYSIEKQDIHFLVREIQSTIMEI